MCIQIGRNCKAELFVLPYQNSVPEIEKPEKQIKSFMAKSPEILV